MIPFNKESETVLSCILLTTSDPKAQVTQPSTDALIIDRCQLTNLVITKKCPLGCYDIIPPVTLTSREMESDRLKTLTPSNLLPVITSRRTSGESAVPLGSSPLPLSQPPGTHNRNPKAYLKFHLIPLIIVENFLCQTSADGSQAPPAILAR